MAKILQWLAQVKEEAIEPELPICDAHHHLWDQARAMTSRAISSTRCWRHRRGHNIIATVYVQCHDARRRPGRQKPLGEVEFVNGVAARAASGLYGKTRVAPASSAMPT